MKIESLFNNCDTLLKKFKSKEKLSKALSRLKELEYDAYIRKLRSPSSET